MSDAGKRGLRRFLLGLGVVALAYGAFALWRSRIDATQPAPEMVLLLPDTGASTDPLVQVWRDAAAETGTLLRIERASAFLQPVRAQRPPVAVVMPDSVHRRASAALVNRLESYVRDGGALMLVFDAASLTPNGTYPRQRSRLSGLAGVDYGLYDGLASRATRTGTIAGAPSTMERLGIPPGKYMRDGRDAVVSTYIYGRVNYAHFVTEGGFDGEALLRANDGSLVAGLRRVGNGRVLFVNLPLGYLRSRSDGALLHGTLAYFNDEVARLPRLLPVPDGVGGMVLNWHVDSNASYAALASIEANTRLLQSGPFSIHVTAGPDTYRPGDRAGFGVDSDPRARPWLRRFMRDGHAIGSHGGWIHNLFGRRLRDDNEAEFSKYLDLNFQSLERATGRRVIEYSAPDGNQPQWVTDWLDRRGVLAYYFTGDTGMAPTRTYRDGRRSDRSTWAFPITTYGRAGSFEEAMEHGVPLGAVRAWLRGIADFTSRQRTVRLMYFHPPGVMLYAQPMQELVDYSREVGPQRFRWYTMGEHARFLTRREAVQWTVRAERGADVFAMRGDLGGMAWTLPKARYARPVVVQGRAAIVDAGTDWLVRSPQQARLGLRAARAVRATRP